MYTEVEKLDNSHNAVGLDHGRGWKIIRTNASPESLPNILKGTFFSLDEAREALKRHQYQQRVRRLDAANRTKSTLTPFIIQTNNNS